MTQSVQPLLELETSQTILASLDCPRALTVSIMLRYGHYDDLISLRTVPEDYLDSDSFFLAYQATRLLQKSEWLPTSFDKEAVALKSFWAAESQCRQTNELLRGMKAGTVSLTNPSVMKLIKVSQRKVRHILKRFSPYDFLDSCGFGPGADLSTRGGFTSAYNKLASRGSVTRQCSRYLDFLANESSLGRLFLWSIDTRSIDCDRVEGNRVAFVPKDCKTKRTIAVEPRWNVFFQKGMGVVLRRALQREGIDLDDQSWNQWLAQQGSLRNNYATLDLASASDSVSYELVKLLLPKEWVTVLEHLRSPYFSLKGKWYRSEKWSSMGNGYTFELESIIFYSLIYSICGSDCSVYGDDLIFPQERYSEIVDLLTFAGFSVNQKKSFATGPFRESCGGDFFNGVKVTPIYWKDPLNDQGTLRLVNQITVLAQRISGDHSRDRRFRRVWGDLVHRLPKHFRYKGPNTISSCIHSPSGEWAARARWGWDGWEVKVSVPIPNRFRYRHFSAAVLSQFFSPSSDGYTIRDRVHWAVKRIFIPTGSFEDIGTWSQSP